MDGAVPTLLPLLAVVKLLTLLDVDANLRRLVFRQGWVVNRESSAVPHHLVEYLVIRRNAS